MGQLTRCGQASRRRRLALGLPLAIASSSTLLAGCSGGGPAPGSGVVRAVGAESQYADVLRQIGGRYVSVASILDNPNTDPHAFESSPSVARQVAQADLVVQNGLGYDGFMDKIESASQNAHRRVLVAQHVVGLRSSTPNPHLWYDPRTMPAVAGAIAGALSALLPSHGAYFRANLQAFDASLDPWRQAIASFRGRYPGVAVATTEPVADYLLDAMGADNRTPFSLQADIMNGVDPPPEAITREEALLSTRQVKVFCYNTQVVSALTASIRKAAVDAGVPVVAVYETMPAGIHYQRWMVDEVRAVEAAVTAGVSTEHL